jgi:Fe-S cluster assembly iron-binding protein IscA
MALKLSDAAVKQVKELKQQGLTGGFTFVNPNAKSSCGCGSSFSAEGGAAHQIKERERS